MGREYMQIGEVAQQTGLSLRTIRYYDEMGLLVPSARTAGGFRLYTDADVARLRLIKRMRPLDFTLEESKDLLETLDALETEVSEVQREKLLARLDMFHHAAQAQVADIQEQLATAESFATDLRTEITRQRRTARPTGSGVQAGS